MDEIFLANSKVSLNKISKYLCIYFAVASLQFYNKSRNNNKNSNISASHIAIYSLVFSTAKYSRSYYTTYR